RKPANLILDPLSQSDRQSPHVFPFIIRAFKTNRRFNDEQVLLFLVTPRREDGNDRSVCSQCQFSDDESRRSVNAHEIDKERLVVERVQIGEQSERSFTRAQNFQHRASGRELVESLITKPRANAIDELLDLRIIDSAHEKSERVADE